MRKGRFNKPFDAAMRELNSSLDVDQWMLFEDIQASLIHAGELRRLGILDKDEFEAIVKGLEKVYGGIEDGTLELDPEFEDIHMNVEVLLRRFTPAADKLHTARSRNDQVVTDFRLFCRNNAQDLALKALDLAAALRERAREADAQVVPEYTHTQRAQVTRLGHHLLAWVYPFLRDCERFIGSRDGASRCALGSGASVGVNYPYDRDAVAGALDMAPPIPSSLDAVSDRDFAMDFLYACAACATHLSRLGAEWVLWSTQEFGFMDLPEAFCSGSSIMPQKQNPDAAELLRGKAAGVVGDLSAMLNLVSGLPLGYSKDLQDDKPPVIRAAWSLRLTLDVATGIASDARFHGDRMGEAAADPGLYAVDMADELVARGVPFRRAHEAVGKLMRHLSEDPSLDPRTMTRTAIRKVSSHLLKLDFGEILDPARSVERHCSPGGPSRASMKKLLSDVTKQIRSLKRKL